MSSADEFDTAIETAFKEDNRILIEEFLDGREFACGLYLKNKELNILPLAEVITENDFFDFEAKYTHGLAKEVTPPENLSLNDEVNIKDTSSLLFNKLDCKGVVRIDYMLTENKLYLIEINTVPGMSEASILLKQVKAMGMTIPNLLDTLVENMFD